MSTDEAPPQALDETPAYRAGQAERRFAQALAILRALALLDGDLARDLAERWADTLDALADS